jgi:methionine synthase II (cobalamin-independent)
VDTLRKKDTLRALVAEQAGEHSQPVLDETGKLLAGLTSKFEAERVDAAKGLGKLQTSDERMVKALVTALNDEYQSVKRAARAALDAPAHQAFMKTRPEYQKYVSEG